jgi:hypothetical protein
MDWLTKNPLDTVRGTITAGVVITIVLAVAAKLIFGS